MELFCERLENRYGRKYFSIFERTKADAPILMLSEEDAKRLVDIIQDEIKEYHR